MENNIYYTLLVNNIPFTVPLRYQNLFIIGYGSQGVVCAAYDALYNRYVAIKQLVRPFENQMRAKRSFRELKLSKCMNHKNIIRLLDVFTPDDQIAKFDKFYLVTELMDFNLLSIRNHLWDHTKLSFVIYQILCGLRYLHSAGIIHRDLKPSNITLRSDYTLKIIDFGLARAHNECSNKTTYVVTRYYRAPEIIVGKNYKENADIWSLGCIFAELVRGYELFRCDNQLDQWIQIVKELGTPPESFFEDFQPSSHKFVTGLPRYEGHSFDEMFSDILFSNHNEQTEQNLSRNEEARDLLRKMLKIDLNERITVDAAITHSYFSMWHTEEEMNSGHPAVYDHCLEQQERSVEEWKRLTFEEIKGA